jgi:hypothetical protein
MAERTAQRYMNLAINEQKLIDHQIKKSTAEKRHTVADLTLNEACRLVKGGGGRQKSPHDKYVAAEDNLIEKLEQLGSGSAIAEAAQITLKRLNAAVAALAKTSLIRRQADTAQTT